MTTEFINIKPISKINLNGGSIMLSPLTLQAIAEFEKRVKEKHVNGEHQPDVVISTRTPTKKCVIRPKSTVCRITDFSFDKEANAFMIMGFLKGEKSHLYEKIPAELLELKMRALVKNRIDGEGKAVVDIVKITTFDLCAPDYDGGSKKE